MCEITLTQGAGTDDNTLMRVMVSRSEVDMLDIRASFRKMFACSLHSMIKVGTKTNTHNGRKTVASVLRLATTVTLGLKLVRANVVFI